MTSPVLTEINDVVDIFGYLKHIHSFDSQNHHVLLFRGQSTDAPLLPSIARLKPHIDSTEVERTMLRELRRRGNSFEGLKNMDDWDLIVYAQHHEMKTRLLDWTSNPLAALWFACNQEHKIDYDSFVYILTGTQDFEVTPNSDKSPFDIGHTRVLRPALNSTRIIAQSGWFTIQRFSESHQRFVPLEQNKTFKDKIWRIKIPAYTKKSMLESLSRFGIRSSTMFPGVIGLCHHMNWKFSNVEDNNNPA